MFSITRGTARSLGLNGGRVFSKTVALSDAQLEQMNKATCIAVDREDRPLGPIRKMDAHKIKQKLPVHRAFSLLIFNSNSELLVTQRSSNKLVFPNHYSNTCCSHPSYTEEELNEEGNLGVKLAAIRRAEFELGIKDLTVKDIAHVTRIIYCFAFNEEWGDQEVDHILVANKNVEYKPNPEEVQDCKWIKKEKMPIFLQECQTKGIAITPWFRVGVVESGILNRIWDNLHRIHQIGDDKIVTITGGFPPTPYGTASSISGAPGV